MTAENITYRVRVGDDGRWHYQGPIWIEAAKTATALRDRAGRSEIRAYRNEKPIGTRVYTFDANNKPAMRQEGSMK